MYIYMHGLKEDTLFEFIRTCSIRSTSPISCELITCHIWYFAGLAAWENDYRHHRCLKISRNCYETWSLQETMVTAQKFAWSQLGAGNSNIFLGNFTPKICGSDEPKFDVPAYIFQIGWFNSNHQPAASDAFNRFNSAWPSVQNAAKQTPEKTPWMKPFVGEKLVMVFIFMDSYMILPMVIHHEKNLFLLMNMSNFFSHFEKSIEQANLSPSGTC